MAEKLSRQDDSKLRKALDTGVRRRLATYTGARIPLPVRKIEEDRQSSIILVGSAVCWKGRARLVFGL